ncbi:MAG TPA: lasso peptide biosynthesis B2 protein [Chloroflexota bacterium]|nr:lasso peptide biosynthesis B2 protein [Chloroflexota bacterium]
MSSWWWRPSRPALRRARDLFHLGHIFCVAAIVPLLFRLPLPWLQTLLAPRRAPRPTAPAQEEWVIDAVQGMLRRGYPLLRRGCLTRGVTLYYFLRRAGVEVTLCFGLGRAASGSGGMEGHCWLVKRGEPLLEARDPRPLYTVMYTFPRTPEGGA